MTDKTQPKLIVPKIAALVLGKEKSNLKNTRGTVYPKLKIGLELFTQTNEFDLSVEISV